MSSERKTRHAAIARRDVLRVLATGVGAAAAGTVPLPAAAAQSAEAAKKARAGYDANSREVQTFYRVNRYPPR
jgi:hypothetical protein